MLGLLSKFPYYDLLNNIIPGAVFYFLLQQSDWRINSDSDFEKIISIIFFGMTSSRLGSILESFLQKGKLITFAPYCDYVKASKLDEKLDVLNRQRNLYRSIVGCVVLYFAIIAAFYFGASYRMMAFAVLVIYVISYVKQTRYVAARVKSDLDSHVCK